MQTVIIYFRDYFRKGEFEVLHINSLSEIENTYSLKSIERIEIIETINVKSD